MTIARIEPSLVNFILVFLLFVVFVSCISATAAEAAMNMQQDDKARLCEATANGSSPWWIEPPKPWAIVFAG